MELNAEMEMTSQDQNSLESEHISLLHDKILQENNHFSLTQLSPRVHHARNHHTRPRHTSNTKIQRLKPSSTAPPATAATDMDSADRHHPAPSLAKHTSFHGFPLPLDLDGDTQPMPSQFYKNFTSGLGTEQDTQLDDETAADTEQETPQIDLMKHWQQPTYHELSSDEDEEKDEGQYFLSSVARPTFPKTPATAGRKRNSRGHVIPSTTSTKTPGSAGMSAFAFGNAAPLTSTQLFQATQAPSSPVPDGPRSDPVLSRPSPNIKHSSPGQHLAFSSPSKGSMQSPSRSANTAGRLSRPGTRDGLSNGNAGILNGPEERGENDWEYHDREGFSLDDDDMQHSPASESMDEYDEFAQSIRFSQRQASSSPQPDHSDGENDHAESSSRTSIQSSQHAPEIGMPHASAPSGRQESSHQLPDTQILPETNSADYAVADSQPTRADETQPPPTLVEPSSMSSFVPGSYPLSQTTQRLQVLKRDAADSSSIPKPPPTTSQIAPHTQNRLPSSPPQLPAVAKEYDEREELGREEQSRLDHVSAHTGLSSSLPETRLALSQRTKELKGSDHQQSSNVPETDPADQNRSSNQQAEPLVEQPLPPTTPKITLVQQQIPEEASSTNKDASPAKPTISQSDKIHASQSLTRNQTQTSALSTQSPRKAAGILNFADIATDQTPPDVAGKDLDLNIDILSNDDHDFMDIMTSPPAKKMRLYSKKGRQLARARSKVEAKSPAKPKAAIKSPVKATTRTVTFHTDPSTQESESGVTVSNVFGFVQQEDIRLEPTNDAHPGLQNDIHPVDAPAESAPKTTAEVHRSSSGSSDRPREQVQVEKAVSEKSPKDSFVPHAVSPCENDNPPTPTLARGEEDSDSFAASDVREKVPVHVSLDAKTASTRNSPGRLVRPKRRTSAQSLLRTPISRKQGSAEVPRSKLSHVQRLSQGEKAQQKETTDQVEPTVSEPHRQTPAMVTNEQDAATDVSMTDVASERNDENEANDDTAPGEMTQPDRVLALFKGTGQAYYPATCLGAATLDGLKLRIRFDDGTVTQLDSFQVRRLDLRRGDQVKVDLQGMRSKLYIVVGFQDKITQVEPDSYPKTDIHGFQTLQLVPKDRDSIAAAPRVETAALLRVPITNTYLTHTMWVRFEGRNYLPSTASMTIIATGHSSRPQTPVPQDATVATPASRTRRGTVTSIHTSTITSVRSLARPDFASPLQSGRGIFSGMAFAVSYSADSPEKNRVLDLIQSQGGLTLEKGFDELFSVRDLGDTAEEAQNPSSSSNGNTDALVLSARAQTLGFVALIADKHSRRAKYVQALALSLPCLSGRWILDSVASATPLPWTKYLLPAGESAFLSGAVRSRTLTPYLPTTAKLAQIVQERERLLQGGRVLLVSAGAGGRKWEARRAYAFLTVALGASVVRRVSDLESAKRILDAEQGWGWVYVEGTIEEAESVLFRGGSVEVNNTVKKSRKRKREDDGKEKMVAVGRDGKVRIVGDEFVVQSLILGDLMV